MVIQAPGELGKDEAGESGDVEKAGDTARREGLAQDASPRPKAQGVAPLCWPFPVGSQNNTDMAVKLKPYVPPKRRTLNQY